MQDNHLKLKDKIVLITNAASESGTHTALYCATQGASLTLNFSNKTDESLKSKILSITKRVSFTNFDVSIYADGESLVSETIDKYGKLDSLINTPDSGITASIEDIKPDEFYDSVRHDLKSTFVMTKFACKVMRTQRFGNITNMISDAGLGIENLISSSATSEGIIGMTRTVSRDMAKYGVICNAICVSDFVSASVLAASFSLNAMQSISGRTFGTKDGSIFIYQEPRPIDTISKWGGFELEELHSIIPKTIDKTLSGTEI
ncbi:MAG: SDR family NAD(P)-dependent oxidoreductase [SAR202 cluster bacterium]|mgnify:CR=1 FL=1|nr:SDR family NAD(P)-dependent oxidoreductase [SAR202 cluster bacterium]|tara:strand:+ start:23571 stop:24353 length:783 start_codon:yes stop_codon:yes gene_type:complete